MSQKIAIVTGNYKGLGKSISEALTNLGYQEPDIIRREDYDLTQASNAQRLVRDTLNRYGRLDLLINNVGDFIHKNISEIDINEWQNMINSNLNSAFYMCHFALEALRASASSMRASHILNIGYAGMEHFRTFPATTAYQAGKAGLLVLSKGLAKSEGPNNILVNMLSPGHMENTIGPYALENISLGRLASLKEARDAALFLISQNYITGQNLEVAGGWGL